MAWTSTAASNTLDTEETINNDIADIGNTVNDYASFYNSIVSPDLQTVISINDPQTGGFVFDYCDESKGEFRSEITEHYVESKNFVQDHMAFKSRRFTLKGLCGELVQKPPTGVSALLSTIQSNMTVVQSYLGNYTPGAVAKMQNAVSTAQNVMNKINADVAKANKVLNLIAGTKAKSKQAQAYGQLESLRVSRSFVTLFMPYQIFHNMAIESIEVTSPEDSKFWTNFTITLVQVRIVDSTLAQVGDPIVGLQQRAFRPVNKSIGTGTIVENTNLLDSFD